MIEGLVLIEGEMLSEETLGSVSLGNALQMVIGSVPGGGVILHIAADSADYFGGALLEFARVQGVARVLTLMLKTAQQ